MARITLIVSVLLISLAGNAFSEESTEPFYAQIGRAVIRLEHTTETTSEGNSKAVIANNPDGTGFFVWSGDRLFLISARHVVDTDHDLHARVKVFNTSTQTSEILLLKLPRKHWIYHPDQGDATTNAVDIAVIRLTLPVWDKFAGSIKGFAYEPGETEVSQLAFEDALPPEQVVTFGFPGEDGFKLLEQRPMARFGIISMHTGEKFIMVSNNYANERCDVLDIKAFPGNSGSPVMSATGGTHLLGVLIASNNSDIAVMEPASRIREILEIGRKTPIKEFNFWSKYLDATLPRVAGP
jgi:hypothetical protein